MYKEMEFWQGLVFWGRGQPSMAGGLQEPGRRLVGRELEGFLGHFLKGPVVAVSAISHILQVLSLWPLGKILLLGLCGWVGPCFHVFFQSVGYNRKQYVSLLDNAFNCYSENFQEVLSSSLAVDAVWEVVAPSAWPLGRPEFSWGWTYICVVWEINFVVLGCLLLL